MVQTLRSLDFIVQPDGRHSRILAWPAEKVLMAHGTPAATEAPTFLRQAFGWLT